MAKSAGQKLTESAADACRDMMFHALLTRETVGDPGVLSLRVQQQYEQICTATLHDFGPKTAPIDFNRRLVRRVAEWVVKTVDGNG